LGTAEIPQPNPLTPAVCGSYRSADRPWLVPNVAGPTPNHVVVMPHSAETLVLLGPTSARFRALGDSGSEDGEAAGEELGPEQEQDDHHDDCVVVGRSLPGDYHRPARRPEA
jgi:hypothetical protein